MPSGGHNKKHVPVPIANTEDRPAVRPSCEDELPWERYDPHQSIDDIKMELRKWFDSVGVAAPADLVQHLGVSIHTRLISERIYDEWDQECREEGMPAKTRLESMPVIGRCPILDYLASCYRAEDTLWSQIENRSQTIIKLTETTRSAEIMDPLDKFRVPRGVLPSNGNGNGVVGIEVEG